jgi:stage V sporulation protein AC
MANETKKKLTKTQQEYQALAKTIEPKRPVMQNCLRAFFAGGVICLIGQCLSYMYINAFHFSKQDAGDPTVVTLILISVILTCFGVYDRIAQWAGAGSAVPVTGFANSMSSAAIEHRAEGIVLGVGGNMFKIAGGVIVFGTVAAFVIGIISYIYHGGGH